jgi:hypothetical protein
VSVLTPDLGTAVEEVGWIIIMTISVIVGSTRQGRFSEKPAQWILQELRKREAIEARLLDLRDFPMPFFDQPMPPAMPERPADRALADALRQRCKAESVSVHAALLVGLDRAPFAVFGKKLPKWIDNQIDPRRGRFAALKDDRLLLGGGSFKVRAGQAPEAEFWARARAIN